MTSTSSVFEPQVVKNLLKATRTGQEKKDFEAKWDRNVKKRVEVWEKNQSQCREQLQWESEVVEYVNLVYKDTTAHANATTSKPPLRKDIPLLGPRFVPPTFFHMAKREKTPKITARTSYLIALTVVHPFYFPIQFSKCPQCTSVNILWEGWTTTGARDVHGVRKEERALGLQMRCKDCKIKYGKGGSEVDVDKKFCFATTSRSFWETWEHWKIPRSIPYFLTRSAITHELFDLVIELRPSSTSSGLAGHIEQLHLLEYWQEFLEYLNAFGARTRTGNPFVVPPSLEAFSLYSDPGSYNGNSISGDLITDIYLAFVEKTRQEESIKYCKTRTAICLSMDNTFKSAGKAVVIEKNGQRTKMMKGGILSAINERSEILSWRFCQSASPAEIREMLDGITKRCIVLGIQPPEMAVVDNCCMVRRQVQQAMPDIKIILDVYHFLMRYLAVVLNGTKNPRRAEVAKDIRDSIISTPASKDGPAKYWDGNEQVKRLEAAYKKWSDYGGVWSAAAPKVHADQLGHAKRACLVRHRQDIATDGSRIEGSHKAWNSLQRAQPSGIEVYAALAHDFVLRRNIRISRARVTGKKPTFSDPFVSLTSGSHHIDLVNSAATIFNLLRQKERPEIITRLSELPILPDVPSDETFGLVQSSHTESFGGLFVVKEEEQDIDDMLQQVADRSEDIDQAAFMDELGVNSAQLLRPDNRNISQSAANPIGSALGSPSVQLTSMLPTSLSVPKTTPTLSLIAQSKRKAEFCEENIVSNKRTKSNAEQSEISAPANLIDMDDEDSIPSGIIDCEPTSDVNEPANIPTNTAEYNVRNFFRFKSTAEVSTSRRALSSGVSGESATQLNPPNSTNSAFTTAPKNPPPLPYDVALTRSQKLFSLATQTNPLSLAIRTDDEFYLFMDMRAEFQWTSFTMNARKWATATHVYNARLEKICQEKGSTAIKKNPRALMDKLGEIEPEISKRISNGDFKSKRSNSETFWRTHCTAVPSLVKSENSESAESQSSGPTRKVAVCSRCKTLMYPGPPGSAGNHRKGYCSDGVRQKASNAADKPLPDWPQPSGIFLNGSHFDAMRFLETVRALYDRVVDQSVVDTDYSMEDEAFSRMLSSRTIVSESSGMILFRLFDLKNSENTPSSLLVQLEGINYLRVDCLNQLDL